MFYCIRMASLSPKTSPFLSFFSRNFKSHCPFTQSNNPILMARKSARYYSTSAAALHNIPPTTTTTRKTRKDKKIQTPEMTLQWKLGLCSKKGELLEALCLYDEAKANNVMFNVHHYNVLLYLCSLKTDGTVEDERDFALEKGFNIFKQMAADNVTPNEATFTNASRLAAEKEDPELAFDLVKRMKDHGIAPKLRSYGPALFGFCKKGMADKAYEVDTHMIENEVLAEEPELSALLRISSEVNREEKVYEMMHRLRATVRQVSEETAVVMEDWFRSTKGSEVGAENWDLEKVRKGILEGGGGWHGRGWLGKGNWRVLRTEMDERGVCKACGEKLVSIDIDPQETENFAKSLAKLACTRSNFVQFQGWLQRNGPFEAVVDGANLGLANQRVFSFHQLNRVVNQLREMSPTKKMPLVILHQSRVTGGPAQNPNNKKLLGSWTKAGALYSTPHGSNDDWFWLYAAVSSNCLLVTNDEMRDHLFNLLGNSFFPRWKEKHQVRVKPSKNGLTLQMPPLYSIVIQESEKGSWHIPTITEDDLETPRQWVCATRTVTQ